MVKVLAAILNPVCCINVHYIGSYCNLDIFCGYYLLTSCAVFFLLEWNDAGAPNYKTIIGYNHFYSFQKTGQ